ncbi:MAG: thiamine diphosphokinase [Chloroflexi bacterium]|nr:thiamine diphosphokinase [Chloroflexota bacterium]
MTVLIFVNGEINDVDWIRPYLESATAVLAADGGSRHLYTLRHLPDLVIGDMDSLPLKVQHWLAENGVPRQTHPPVKDETDLELALLYAAEHFPDDLLLFGTLGGRLDQTLANILLLTHPRLYGRRVEIITGRERAWLVHDHSIVQGQIGDTVSLIPLGSDVQIETTAGLKWSLQNDVLTFGLARGVSNVLTAVTATITLQSGTLLCIHTPS